MSNLLPYRKDKKYLPHELLQMYRRRAALTQTELAGLIGLQSRRMIPAWEAGESLPKPDRLEKLLEVYLQKAVFISGHEVEEAQQLWDAVKSLFDTNSERLAAYPVFDNAWFENLLRDYLLNPQPTSNEKIAERPKPELHPVPLVVGTETEETESTGPVSSLHTNNLVVSFNRLIGRKREVAEVCELLSQANIRLVTLTGPGGTGKTRLSAQVATELLPDFQDGNYLVRLEAARDRQAVVAAVALTLGVKELALTEATNLQAPPVDNLWLNLKQFLQAKHMLLVLDNFEQVVSASSVVSELLAETTQLKILVTSREVLHLYGEQEYPVPPLELPPPNFKTDAKQSLTAERLSQYPAVQLFVERARLIQPDFVLTEQNGPIVAELCLRLDGLPLALELAAGRLKLFSPQTLLERLTASTANNSEPRLKMLSGGARDLPGRQQTLRNTLEWSYNLLEAAEQRMFRWLGVFVGGCSLTAIEAVYLAVENAPETDALELVASLVNKSLLRQTQTEENTSGGIRNEVRFKMLETIREYAWEQLSRSSELELARRQHALYYLSLAKQAEPMLHTGEQVEWLTRLETEHDNLRAALDRTLGGQPEQVILGLELVGALWLFWSTHAHISEGRARLTRALEQARKAGLDATLEYAKALNGSGHLARLQGEYASARLRYTESLAIYRTLDNIAGVAASLNNLGISTTLQGDYEAARIYYQESLELRRKLNDKAGISRCLNNLGVVTTQQGDYEAANAFYQESLAISRELGAKNQTAICLNNLGEVAMHRREYTAAQTFVEEAMAIDVELGDKNSIASCFKLLGDIAVCRREESLAEDYFAQAMNLYQEVSNKQGIAEVLESSSVIALRQGDYNLAYTQLEKAITMLNELGDKRTLAYCLEGFASLAAARKQAREAVKLFGAAVAIRQLIGAPISPFDRLDYNYYRSVAEAQVSATEFAEAWAEGQALNAEQAVTFALATR